ncbi:MAG TPA: DUF1127 domain-containing protein, partial [Stellaceae bacterium]|nr:DUF1127 domain-containing protein [Stellaceae bacterium]
FHNLAGRLTYCATQHRDTTMFFKELEMLNLILSGLQHLQGAYSDWRRRQAAYDELSALDDRSLADIGITRADIPYLFSRDVHEAARAQAAGLAQNDNRRAA